MSDVTARTADAVQATEAEAAALGDRARAIAGDVGAKAQELSGQVRKAVSEGAETARDWAADQSDVLRDTVQTKPFIAVGVSAGSAFAAGIILGVLLARR
ncbi:hypothetical protein BH09PSE2_BH09PSE2_18960 [soil metagenome]